MTTETIDIIYCYRDRDLERVKNSFESLALQTNKQFSVIFIDYGSNGKISQEAKDLCALYHFCRYVFIDTQGKTWSRAEALNYGFHVSRTSHVFTSDIDMVFKNTFVDYLFSIAKKDVVSFFSVGYLSEKSTSSIDLQNLGGITYTRSKDFALGMVFISKEILNKINGYNSFYSLWGAEDNDIKYRIEQAGYKTTFVEQEVFMFHQFHPPSDNDASVLPVGWVQFMKDYQVQYKKDRFVFNGLHQIVMPPVRPAKKIFLSEGIPFQVLDSRKLFIRYHLITGILNNTSGAELAYTIHTSEIKNSLYGKSGELLNRFFKMLGVPLVVNSLYVDQYVSKNAVRDEIYVVLKSMENHITDYYIEMAPHQIKLVIVKK